MSLFRYRRKRKRLKLLQFFRIDTTSFASMRIALLVSIISGALLKMILQKGTEAVKFVLGVGLCKTEEEAVSFFERMRQLDLIHHVCDEHTFKARR